MGISKLNFFGWSFSTIFTSVRKTPNSPHERLTPYPAEKDVPNPAGLGMPAKKSWMQNELIKASRALNLRKVEKKSAPPFQPKSAFVASCTDPNAFRPIIKDACYFNEKTGASQADKNVLKNLLAEVYVGTAVPIEGIDTIAIVQALSAASGKHAGKAAEALQSLRTLDLVGSITRSALQPGKQSDACESERMAWRAAQILATTPLGFAALRKIAIQSRIGDANGEKLRLFLRAGHVILKQRKIAEPRQFHTAVRAAPQDLLNDRKARATLAGKALHAAAEHLVYLARPAIPDRTTSLPTQIAPDRQPNGTVALPTEFKAKDEWALTALHNGLTDALLTKAAKRIQKVGIWMDRALAKKINFVQRGASHVFRSMVHKTPLEGLDGFYNAEHGGVGEKRQMRKAMQELQKGIECQFKDLQPITGSLNERQRYQVRDAVRIAILRHWQTHRDQQLLQGLRVDDEAIINKIREQAEILCTPMLERREMNCHDAEMDAEQWGKSLVGRLTKMADTGDGTRTSAESSQVTECRNRLRNEIDAALHSENESLCLQLAPETLARWAQSVVRPKAIAIEGADWIAFDKAMDRITGTSPETSVAPEMTREALVATLIEAIENFELGSRIKLARGGIAGAGTKKLFQILAALTAGTLPVRLDAKYKHSRQAVIEIGRGRAGMEMFIGTQRTNRFQFATTLFAGHLLSLEPFGVPANGVLGAGLEITPYADERTEANGVVIRLDQLKDGFVKDPERKKEFARMLEIVLAERKDGASAIKELMQELPYLSISVVGKSSEKIIGHGVAPTAGAYGDFANLRIGLNANAPAEYRKIKQKYSEVNGSVRIDRQFSGNAKKANVTGGFDLGFVAQKGDVSDILKTDVQGTTDWRLGVEIYHSGIGTRRTIIYKDGEIAPQSFTAIVHENVQSFVDSVKEKSDVWIKERTKLFSKIDIEAWKAEGGTKAKEAEIAEAETKKEISQFLQQTMDQARPTQNYQEYLYIRPGIAAQINKYLTIAAFAREAGDNARAKELKDACDALINDPRSWQESSFYVTEVASEQRSPGLHFGVTLASLHYRETRNTKNMI